MRRSTGTGPHLSSVTSGRQLIPTFLPVMRGALTYPGSRDPDVLDRLDSVAVRHLAARLQRHLAANADRTAAKQADITAAIVKVTELAGGSFWVPKLTERQYADGVV